MFMITGETALILTLFLTLTMGYLKSLSPLPVLVPVKTGQKNMRRK